jgi:hypothetical protein
MLLPALADQNVLGIAGAGLAILISLAGLALPLFNRLRGSATGIAVLVVCVAALVLCFQFHWASVKIGEGNELLAKAQTERKDAEASLAEAEKNRKEAEEAPNKAAEILKQAEEAPKRAEEMLKQAKEEREKAERAEIKAGELMAKVGVAEAAIELLRKKYDGEQARIDAEKLKLKDLQAQIAEMQLGLQQAKDDLSKLQKQVEQERKKAEQKQKDAADTLKKVEDLIKGMVLNLKSPKGDDRLKALRVLPRLKDYGVPASAESTLCELAATDPVPQNRAEALDAVEKLRPDLYPLIVTLTLPPKIDDRGLPDFRPLSQASGELQRMREKAVPAVPILMAQLKTTMAQLNKLIGTPITSNFDPRAGPNGLARAHMLALAAIKPDDPEILNMLIAIAAMRVPDSDLYTFPTKKLAVDILADIGERQEKLRKTIMPVMLTNLKLDNLGLKITVIQALAKFGPDAADAIPILIRQRTFDPMVGYSKACSS